MYAPLASKRSDIIHFTLLLCRKSASMFISTYTHFHNPSSKCSTDNTLDSKNNNFTLKNENNYNQSGK